MKENISNIISERKIIHIIEERDREILNCRIWRF